ncbi:hypothetical protein [Kibdelosporangium aridum]|uniref:hypothetical protein n=1 Tax=Kibdelosporangium aridum TaxID=2030 RepID=UPI0035ED544E
MTEFRFVADPLRTDPFALRVSWARIPVLWWRDVAVLIAEPVELTMLDRFAVESANRLGRLTAEDFDEFTGLPAIVFAALARRLHTLDLLEWRSDVLLPNGNHTDLDDVADVTRTTEASLDFLYLPDSDDLIAVTESLGEFERAWPRRSQIAPLPDRLHEVSRRELLAARIAARAVVGLPPAIVGLADSESDEPLTAMAGAAPDPPTPVCPVLECSAVVVRDDGEHPVVRLDIGKRKARRSKNNGDDVPVPLNLGEASGLIAAWQQIADKIGARDNRDGVERAVTKVGLDAGQLRFTHDLGWSLKITGPQAEGLAERRSLTEPIGIEVRDEHAHVGVPIRLAPADDNADRLFTIDILIGKLLARPKDIKVALAEHQTLLHRAGGSDAVARRSWALGHFWITHCLREDQDFDYV